MPPTTSDVLDAINSFYQENGYFPVSEDIKASLKIGRTMTYNHIRKLENQGLLTRNPKGHIIATNSFPLQTHDTRTSKKK